MATLTDAVEMTTPDLREMSRPGEMDPDISATLSDFLTYTEHLPSSVARSMTLIADQDRKAVALQQKIHDLLVQYGRFPDRTYDRHADVDAQNIPKSATLRAQISTANARLQRARRLAAAEAYRLSDMVSRDRQRLQIISTKLKAMPMPPSRDPSPSTDPITSPQLKKPGQPSADQRLASTVGTLSARMNDRQLVVVPGEVLPPMELLPPPFDLDETDSDDSDIRSPAHAIKFSSRKDRIKLGNRHGPVRPPKTPKKSHREGQTPAGGSSNSAAISTSSALLALLPPPEDAKDGSIWKPWKRITEFELARLRKRMKKNAIWLPSPAMRNRELKSLGRGHDGMEAARALADRTGQPFVDEYTPDWQDPTHAAVPGQNYTHMSALLTSPTRAAALGGHDDHDDESIINRGMRLNQAKKRKRERELEEQSAETRLGTIETSSALQSKPEAQSRSDRVMSQVPQIESTFESPPRLTQPPQTVALHTKEPDSPVDIIASVEKQDGHDLRQCAGSTPNEATLGATEHSDHPRQVLHNQTAAPAARDALDPTVQPTKIPAHAVEKLSASPTTGEVDAAVTQQDTEAETEIEAKTEKLNTSVVSNEESVRRGGVEVEPDLATQHTAATESTQSKKAARKRKREATPVGDSIPSPNTHSSPPPESSARPSSKRLRVIWPASKQLPFAKPNQTPPSVKDATQPEAVPSVLAKPPEVVRESTPTVSASTSTSHKPSEPVAPRQHHRRSLTKHSNATSSEPVAPRQHHRRSLTKQSNATSSEPPLDTRRTSLRRASNVSVPGSTKTRTPSVTADTPVTRGARGRAAPGLVADTGDHGRTKSSVGRRKTAPERKGRRRSSAAAAKKSAVDEPMRASEDDDDDDGEAEEDVDPDEPRYCVCDGVSHGDMIACERPNCEREWFHLECVGLNAIPARRDKFYCPECRKKVGIRVPANGVVKA